MTRLHPDRYSTTGVAIRKLGVVVHDAETSDGASTSLISALSKPGDRLIAGSDPPRRYGSGYHAIAIFNGYVVMAGDECGPFHAPPVNKTWLSVCLPGYARQTRAEWLDTESRALINGAARYIVDMHHRHGFPLERRSPAELRAGLGGITDHDSVAKAWGQTDHWDPGPQFPWDVLFDDITQLTTPTTSTPEDDDMAYPTATIRVIGGLLPPGGYIVYTEWGPDKTWQPTDAAAQSLAIRSYGAGRQLPEQTVDLNTADGLARMRSMPLYGGAQVLNGINVDRFGIPV
jgi:hypothetical protein